MTEVKAYTAWGRLYGDVRKNAATRGIPFSLSRIDFDKLVLRSEECCMVSGIPFDATPFTGSMRRPFAPSIDRIDSAHGYTLSNVRLVCVLVNLAMNQWGLEPLMCVARNLVEREREIQEKAAVWQSQLPRRRLWSPASYICTKDYLSERYGADTQTHTREVSLWADRYCKLHGISSIVLERPSYQRKDGSQATTFANAYPRSVLELVCNEVIEN